MTDKEYLRKMEFLIGELDRVSAAEPYDRDEHSNIVDTINLVHCQWHRSCRRGPRILILVYIAAILFVLYLVYLLVSEL